MTAPSAATEAGAIGRRALRVTGRRVTAPRRRPTWPFLGAASVTDPELRKRVVSALYRSIAEGAGYFLCFRPHHGLRARRGTATIDLVLCYSCAQLDVASRERGLVPISNASRQILDEILRTDGIPLGSTGIRGADSQARLISRPRLRPRPMPVPMGKGPQRKRSEPERCSHP